MSSPETPEEQVVLIDAEGKVVGSAPRSVMRRDNLRHVVVAVLVRDSAGRVYVHRRTDGKDVFPGRYDALVAGVLQAGEEPANAATRELAEELGIVDAPLTPLFTVWYGDPSTRHLCYGYSTRWDGPVHHQPDEIDWGGWMTVTELRQLLADERRPFVPDGRAFITRWLDESSPEQ